MAVVVEEDSLLFGIATEGNAELLDVFDGWVE
jgi:hypothetical protein